MEEDAVKDVCHIVRHYRAGEEFDTIEFRIVRECLLLAEPTA